MTDIRTLEIKQEMLDNESLMLIRQKSYQLQQLVRSIQYQSLELETAKFANLQGQARISALEAELANQTIQKQNLMSNIQQVSTYLNKLQQICDFLQNDNQQKALTAQQLKEQLQKTLSYMCAQQANLSDAQQQLALFSDRNRLFAQKTTLLERDVQEKEKDVVALAQKCRGLVSDNEKMAKKVYETQNEVDNLVSACRIGGLELMEAHNALYRKIREKSEATALLERCCQQNLDIRNSSLPKREIVRKQLLALCRACQFVSLLRERAKTKDIGKQIERQQMQRKIDKIGTLEFAAAAYVARERGSYKKELFSVTGAVRSKEGAPKARPSYKPSHTVLRARQEAEELKQLRRRVEIIAQQEKDVSNQRNSVQSRNNMLTKQNEQLQSEVQLKNVQISGFEKYIANLTEEIVDKNARLTELECNVNQVKNDLEKELREQTNRAQIAAAKVSALTETLDQREHRILALERDFQRVQARVRAKETELEGARRIVGGIQNVGHDLESAIESKRQRLKDLEKYIEQW